MFFCLASTSFRVLFKFVAIVMVQRFCLCREFFLQTRFLRIVRNERKISDTRRCQTREPTGTLERPTDSGFSTLVPVYPRIRLGHLIVVLSLSLSLPLSLADEQTPALAHPPFYSPPSFLFISLGLRIFSIVPRPFVASLFAPPAAPETIPWHEKAEAAGLHSPKGAAPG